MTVDTAIVEVTAVNVALPLSAPLRLGAMTVHRREYTGIQVRTADGLVGTSYCLSREAPMVEIIDRLIAPHVLGADSADVEAVWETAFRGSAIVGRVGLVRRALGLVDIAVWDIAGQRAGQPVWQLLGTGADPRPTMLVAAYPTADRDSDQLADDVLRLARQGWPLLKIARSPDNALMRDLLARVGERLPAGQGLVVDVAFGWPDADRALADLRSWGPTDLAWLEDPLLPEDAAGCARIRSEGGVRVGVGDEVTDPAVFDRLIGAGALDVGRVDVVAIGGITPARGLIDRMRRERIATSCHVYPEISVHLGAAVETFDRSPHGNPYDPSPLLVRGGPAFVDGHAVPPRTPGLGFRLDPERFAF
ncbi:MAG: mandelate racemase/muconate lactonizing enzyme family protein [Nocardioidaceae bacterium]